MSEVMSQSPIPQSLLNKFSKGVRDGVTDLPREKQEEFLELYRKRSKSIVIAYLRWIILPYQHYAYLELNLQMAIYLLSLGGLGVWAIIDLFRIPKMVRKYNREAARIALADVSIER